MLPSNKPKVTVEETFEPTSGGGDSPTQALVTESYIGASSFADFDFMISDSTADLYDGRPDIISNVGMVSPPRSPFVLPTAPSTSSRSLMSESSDFSSGLGGSSGASLTELVPYTPARGSVPQVATPSTTSTIPGQGAPGSDYISIQTPGADALKASIEEEDGDDDDDDDDDDDEECAEEEDDDDDDDGDEEEEEEETVQPAAPSPTLSMSPPPTPTPITPPPRTPSPSPPQSPIEIPIMTRSLRSRTINPVPVTKKPTKAKAAAKQPVLPTIPWEMSLPSPAPSLLSSSSLSLQSITSSITSKQVDLDWNLRSPFGSETPTHNILNDFDIPSIKPEIRPQTRQLRGHKKVPAAVSKQQTQQDVVATMENRVLNVSVPQKDIVSTNTTHRSEKPCTRLQAQHYEEADEEPFSPRPDTPTPMLDLSESDEEEIELPSPKVETRQRRRKASQKDTIVDEVESIPTKRLRTHTQQKDIVEEDFSSKSDNRLLRTQKPKSVTSSTPTIDKTRKSKTDKQITVKTEKRVLRGHATQKDVAVLDTPPTLKVEKPFNRKKASKKVIVEKDSTDEDSILETHNGFEVDVIEQDMSEEEVTPKTRKGSKKDIVENDTSDDEFTPKTRKGYKKNVVEKDTSDEEVTPKTRKGSKKDIVENDTSDDEVTPKTRKGSRKIVIEKDTSDDEVTPKTRKGSRKIVIEKDTSDDEVTPKTRKGSRKIVIEKDTSDDEVTPKTRKGSKKNVIEKETSDDEVTPKTRKGSKKNVIEKETSDDEVIPKTRKGSKKNVVEKDTSDDEVIPKTRKGSKKNIIEKDTSDDEFTPKTLKGSKKNVIEKDKSDDEVIPKTRKGSKKNIEKDTSDDEFTPKTLKVSKKSIMEKDAFDDEIVPKTRKGSNKDFNEKEIIDDDSTPKSRKGSKVDYSEKESIDEDFTPKTRKRSNKHLSEKDALDEGFSPKTRKGSKRDLQEKDKFDEDSVSKMRTPEITEDDSIPITYGTDTIDEDHSTGKIDTQDTFVDDSPRKTRRKDKIHKDSAHKTHKKSKRVRGSKKDLVGLFNDSFAMSPLSKEPTRESSPEMELADLDFSPKPEELYKRVQDSKKDILNICLDTSLDSKSACMSEYSSEKAIGDVEVSPAISTRPKRVRSPKKVILDMIDLEPSPKENKKSRRSQSPKKGSTDPDYSPTTEKKSKSADSKKSKITQDSKKGILLTETSLTSPSKKSADDPKAIDEANKLAVAICTRKSIIASDEPPPVPDKRLLAIHAFQDANPQMMPLRPGRPVMLVLYCFMNHEYFVLDFREGQNVICITGDNGTGKSAISIAVTFALGGSASQLGRTNKIEEIIKDGHEFAQVDIVLLNTSDSLRDYGSYIGIRRIIDRKNCSRFKICKADVTKESKHWKFRDLAKKELIFIKDMLGIMPENPFQILQQVEVVNFKRISDKDKYKFFYEGVRITPCENILKKAREHIDVARDKQAAIEFEVQCKNRRIKDIDARLEIVQEIDTLEKELKWALVREAEEEKKTAETNLKNLEEQKKECDQRRAEANEFLKSYISNFKLEETNLKKLKEERKRKAQLYDQKTDELKDVDSEIKKTNSRIRNKEKEIRNLTKEVEDLQSAVSKRRDQHDREELRRRIKNDIVPKINLVSDKIKELQGLEHERKLNINKCEQNERYLKSRHNELKKEIAEKQKEIDNAKKANGRLHNNWPPLIKKFVEIVNSTTFKKTPRGPMCMYLSVKEEKWRSVIEVALRSTLFHFTVDNMEDEATMKGIIEKVFGQGSKTKSGAPTIFRSTFFDQKHDINICKTTGAEYPTIFDMIDIKDDPVVYNWVLDTTNVESSLLIEDAGVARQLMSVLRPEIKNCVGAYTSDFYFITPQPKYGSWAQNIKDISNYLQLSSADTPSAQIRLLEKQKNLMKLEMNEVIGQHEGSIKNSHDARKLYDTMHQTLTDKMQELDRLKYEQTQLYDKLGNLEPDAATQNEDIQNHLSEIQTMEAENKKWATQIESKKEEVKDLNKELKILEDEKHVLDEKILTMEDARKSYTHEEGVHKQKLKEHNKTLEKLKPKIKTVEGEIKTAATTVEAKIKDAELLCKKMVTTRDSTSIKNDLEARKMQQKDCTDLEEEKKKMRQERDALKDQVVDQKQNLFILNCLKEAVLSMIRQLDGCLEKTRGIYASKLSEAFRNYMSIFRADGKIRICDTNKTLSMKVDIDGVASLTDPLTLSKDSRALARESRNNICSLSGGERTFSTFLFILAMWHVMECGFFIVDEIDLFLDAMNQQKCQEALFKYMRRTPEAMFFHISPKPISSTIQLPPDRIMFIELKKRLTDSDSNDLENPD